MEIKPDDITWELFTKCYGYNPTNPIAPPDKNGNQFTNEPERVCEGGKTKYPVAQPLTEGQKKTKYKWVTTDCPVCKGSGFLPDVFLTNLTAALKVAAKYEDPNVVHIDATEVPYSFQPRSPYSGYY